MRTRVNNGFTIVELIIVVAIISLLSAIAITTYSSIRVDARDAARSSNATIISQALEKYYEKNGIYPSVVSIVNSQPANTGPAVAAKLSIPESALLMPDMPSSATNGIASGSVPANNYLMYQASSTTDNPGCQTSTSSGCEQFTLRYREEATNTTIVIESRRRS